jgi:ribosomal protein S18 acetylase RimI-like enzyme
MNPQALDDLHTDSATEADIPQLTELNRQLMEDEAHPYPLPVEKLRERMARWVAGEYKVMLFRRGEHVCGYAVWRMENRGAYLRHFFICRDQRRQGLGRAALTLLRRDAFPKDKPVQLEAAVWNTDAIAFWRSVGFRDFSLTLEMKPDDAVT